MKKTRNDLIAEVEELRARLDASEEVLRTAQTGAIDALVIEGPQGKRIFTLDGADHPYRRFVEKMSEGAATLSVDGTILYCNHRLADILKMPLERVISSPFSRFVASDCQWALPSLLHMSAGGSSKAEVTLQLDDGHQVPVLVSASGMNFDNIDGVCLVVTDLTGQKRAEAALRESEERFQLVVEATNEVTWDWDLVSGRVWWNNRFFPQFGYTGDEIAPESGTWAEQLHPDDLERVISGVYTVFAGGIPYWSDEYRFRRADGSYAYVLDRGYITYNDEGEPVRMIGAMMDITRRKQSEVELRALTERLERTNHELQDFAFTASHDLQEPLRKIKAFGSRLRSTSGEALNDDALSYLERIQDAANRVQELIDDLLTYSRITTDAQPFVRVNLAQVAREVLADLEITIEQTKGSVEVGDLPTEPEVYP